MVSNIKKIAFAIFVCIYATKTYSQCATSNFLNPSFEGTAQPHILPPSWLNCNGTTSDTQPGSWGISNPATNGSTWAGLVSTPTWQETVSQVFTPCLNIGQAYSFTIDVLKVDETSDGGGDCDGHIELWGGNSSGSGCDQDVILWTGQNLVTNGPNQNNWVTNTISFTPTQTICQITFIAIQGNCPNGIGDFYMGLDNITAIQPNITLTPNLIQNVSCFGGNNGSATASITAGGTLPFVYTWTPGPISGQTANNLSAGIYTVTVVDGVGCTVANTITITQPPIVTINLTPTSSNCGLGGSINTQVTGGTSPFSFLWAPGGSTAQNPTNLAAGNYTVTVTGGGPCTYTATTTVGNSGSTIASFTQSPNQCFIGNTFNFTTTGTTGGGATYNWSFVGGTPSSSTSQNVTGVTYASSGTYAVNYTVSIGGCSSSATSNVTISPSLVFSVSGNDTICQGSNTSWTINGPPATYTWNPGGFIGTNQTLLPTTTTNYSINAIDGTGCVGSQTFTISVAPTLTLAIGGFPATCNGICDGQAVVLVTPSNGPFAFYSYTWSNGASTPSISAVCANTYSVSVIDLAGCSATNSVIVTQPPALSVISSGLTNVTCNSLCNGAVLITPSGGSGAGFTYLYSPNGAGNNPTNLCSGNYTVTVTDGNNCSANTNFTITQPTPLTISIGAVTPLCLGQAANLTATASGGNGGYIYTWTSGTTPSTGAIVSVSPLTTTSYTVSVTDALNCPAANANVSVSVSSTLSVIASADVAICNGNTTPLTAAATGGNGVYTYTWLPVTAPTVGTPVIASPTATTTYTVVVSDGCGTTPANDNVIVSVNPIPVLTINAVPPIGCAPWCATFNGSSLPASASCNWIFTNGATAANNCSPQICFTDSGSYGATLIVTDINGCSNTLTSNNLVTVYPNPTAAFIFGPQPATELESTISFTDISLGSNIINWEWTFGNAGNSTSSLQNPQFTYGNTGTYTVQLEVTNAAGCSDLVTETVIIDQDFSFYVPNAFSPNGDGTNDSFFTKGVGIDTTKFDLWIYDRWGNLIFFTDDFFKEWDGKVSGHSENVQEDVYVWKVKLRDFKGAKHNYVGHVTVVK